MKRILPLFTFAILMAAIQLLPAQNAGLENRLNRALKLYPDADADKDGKLSMEEALKYVESHPELKAQLAEKMGGKNDADRVSGAASSMTTPASKGLPPGPSVFVCAHSFMIFTATLLPPLVESAGIGYQDAGKQMIGGSRVLQHWNLPDEKNRAKATLNEGRVDVLTVSPHHLLPDEGIDNFTKLGLAKNPKLRVLVQASWPGRDGQLDKDFTNEKRNEATVESLRSMHESYHAIWVKALEAQVRALNATVGHEAVHIVPAGDAVYALRQHILAGTAPGLTKQTDLFRDPLGHPQPPLAALVTYCHFATIYGRSPVGLPVPAGLKDNPKAGELNLLLQKIAWEAVTRYSMSGVNADAANPTSQP
jgi:hypothetical protein